MADNTKIEWTEASWPMVAGCTKVSAGCQSCYAVRDSWRLGHNPNLAVRIVYEGTVAKRGDRLDWSGEVRCSPHRLLWPLRWRKPRRIFACNMGDLWHERVPEAFIDRVFAVVAMTGRHTYQFLTKRADQMVAYMADPETPRRVGRFMTAGTIIDTPGTLDPDARTMADWYRDGVPWPLPNVWLGVTAENQEQADRRIPLLLQVPAAVRWVSLEPLLGPIDLVAACDQAVNIHGAMETPAVDGWGKWLSWVVVGGETGPGARPMHPDWVRSMRHQCQAAGVPWFFKQWGSWAPNCLCATKAPCESVPRPLPGRVGAMFRCGKKAAGHMLDGVEHREYPA